MLFVFWVILAMIANLLFQAPPEPADEVHDEDVGLDDIDDDAERAEEARKLKEVSFVHIFSVCCYFFFLCCCMLYSLLVIVIIIILNVVILCCLSVGC